MKKRLFISLIFILLLIVWFSIFFLIKKNIFTFPSAIKPEIIDTKSNNNSKELTEEDLKKKVEALKNRVKIKDIILKWDSYFQNDQLTLALIRYKEAHKKSPNDDLVIEKIADTLTAMKKFGDATVYYEMLIKHPNFDDNKYILSLFYSYDLKNKEQVDLIKSKINENVIDEEKKFFYTNTLYCLEDFHLCKKNFDEKIFAKESNITWNELNEIKNAIQNYTNFWLVDIYYKNALLIWSFMKLKLYPISIILWENLLKEKNDYKAILQIVAQSYFELWDYENANWFLKRYFELSPDDANAAYILWIINIKVWEYILSNIYLNKAITLLYKDPLNVKRKLIYNYYILENYEKMYQIFDDMLKNEKDITLDDIIPVIIFAIENDLNNKAYEWTKIALNKFPEEVTLYAYMWKLEIDRWFVELAEPYLNKWLEINPKNQLVNFYLWLLKIKENNLDEAKKYLEESLKLDKKSEIAKEIKSTIEKIENWFYTNEVEKDGEKVENIDN